MPQVRQNPSPRWHRSKTGELPEDLLSSDDRRFLTGQSQLGDIVFAAEEGILYGVLILKGNPVFSIYRAWVIIRVILGNP